MKILECGRLFEGCPGRVEAETEEEILQAAAVHAREAHGLDTVDDATTSALRGAIRTV